MRIVSDIVQQIWFLFVTPYLPNHVLCPPSHQLSSPSNAHCRILGIQTPMGAISTLCTGMVILIFRSPDLIKASSQDYFGLDPHFSHSVNLCVI